MSDRGIALRYAKAIFTLDLQKNELKKRLGDFDYVLEIFDSTPKLVSVLIAPDIIFEEKKITLKKCLKGISDKLFLNFIYYLIQKNRLLLLHSIFLEYKEMFDDEEGIWEAKMYTAQPVEEKIKNEVQTKLEKFYNKKFVIQEIIDPKIIGGMLIKVANHVIDWGVTTRLEKLEDNLLATDI